MIRKYLKKYGIIKVSITITGFCIVISVLITALLNQFISGQQLGYIAIIIAIIVAAIIGSIFSYSQLRLLSELISTQDSLHFLSITDDLTQVHTRRYFYQQAKAEVARLTRHGGQLSIMMIDFDNFKKINDEYGHLAGDKTLQEMSRVTRNILRENDTIARYGGDEFIILFPQTSLSEVEIVAERLCSLMSNSPVDINGKEIHYTVSIGTTTYKGGEVELDELIQSADMQLDLAKRKGGNTVSIGSPASELLS